MVKTNKTLKRPLNGGGVKSKAKKVFKTLKNKLRRKKKHDNNNNFEFSNPSECNNVIEDYRDDVSGYKKINKTKKISFRTQLKLFNQSLKNNNCSKIGFIKYLLRSNFENLTKKNKDNIKFDIYKEQIFKDFKRYLIKSGYRSENNISTYLNMNEIILNNNINSFDDIIIHKNKFNDNEINIIIERLQHNIKKISESNNNAIVYKEKLDYLTNIKKELRLREAKSTKQNNVQSRRNEPIELNKTPALLAPVNN